MAVQEGNEQADLEAKAKLLTARMNSVRYIGQQAMWMHGCCWNILKEYENATNIDEKFATMCRVMSVEAHAKAKACEEHAASLQERLKRITDKLAGEE